MEEEKEEELSRVIEIRSERMAWSNAASCKTSVSSPLPPPFISETLGLPPESYGILLHRMRDRGASAHTLKWPSFIRDL